MVEEGRGVVDESRWTMARSRFVGDYVHHWWDGFARVNIGLLCVPLLGILFTNVTKGLGLDKRTWARVIVPKAHRMDEMPHVRFCVSVYLRQSRVDGRMLSTTHSTVLAFTPRSTVILGVKCRVLDPQNGSGQRTFTMICPGGTGDKITFIMG